MDNFDLKKFLTENKITKNSKLFEAFGALKLKAPLRFLFSIK